MEAIRKFRNECPTWEKYFPDKATLEQHMEEMHDEHGTEEDENDYGDDTNEGVNTESCEVDANDLKIAEVMRRTIRNPWLTHLMTDEIF